MKPEPPLLMIATGRRPRPRKAPVQRPRELTLHFAVAKLLDQHARDDWRWTHFPAGELRDARTAGKLKRMGVKPGWPDFLLISPRGQLHKLELKRIGEGLTEEQEELQTWCIAHGVPYAVASTMDEVLTIFAAWGVLRIKLAVPAGALLQPEPRA